LLYLWHYPRSLTDFLAPNHIDWTVPEGVEELEDGAATEKQSKFIVTTRVNDTVANAKTFLFRSPRALIDVHWETYNSSVSLPIAFCKLWNYMFKPNEFLQETLNEFWNEHPPGEYSAAHIRLLHPSFYNFQKAKVFRWEEDKNLPWTNETIEITVPPTIHALRCVAHDDLNHPIYLFSDWRTVVHQLQAVLVHKKLNHSYAFGCNSPLDTWVAEKMNHIHLLDSIEQREVAHLKTPNQTLQAYASSFVDIYIAAGAKCLSYGLGRFGYLTSLIGGHSCLNRHQHPTDYMIKRWNMWESVKRASMCTVSPEYPKGIDPYELFMGFWTHKTQSPESFNNSST